MDIISLVLLMLLPIVGGLVTFYYSYKYSKNDIE